MRKSRDIAVLMRKLQYEEAHAQLCFAPHLSRLNYAAQVPMPPLTAFEYALMQKDKERLDIFSVGIFPSVCWDQVTHEW